MTDPYQGPVLTLKLQGRVNKNSVKINKSEQTEEAERLIIDTSHLKIELNQKSFGKEDLLNLENVYLKMNHIMNEAQNSTDK